MTAGDVGQALVRVLSHWKLLLTAAFVIAVAVFLLKLAEGSEKDLLGQVAASDTAPAEFLYLDNVRVRAYLGQALGGLSDSQRRTLSSTSNLAGKVNVGPAEASGSRGRGSSVEETVTPQTTDLFLGLLDYLRTRLDKADRLKDFEVRTRLPARAPLVRRLLGFREGGFVRLEQAHLYLTPFAALMDRARPAASFEDGRFLRRSEERRPVNVPEPDRQAYVADLVKQDPQLPFVIPVTDLRGQPMATFLVPARYSALLDNPRLLAGNLTVVGKILFIERRFVDDPHCPERSREPCVHTDSETARAFGPALARSRPSVRRALGLAPGEDPTEVVADAVTFRNPLVVLLPVAIYQ